MSKSEVVFLGDAEATIDSLNSQYGITGENQPIGPHDPLWMRGYTAACEQILKGIRDGTTHHVDLSPSTLRHFPAPGEAGHSQQGRGNDEG